MQAYKYIFKAEHKFNESYSSSAILRVYLQQTKETYILQVHLEDILQQTKEQMLPSSSWSNHAVWKGEWVEGVFEPSAAFPLPTDSII